MTDCISPLLNDYARSSIQTNTDFSILLNGFEEEAPNPAIDDCMR